jgi:hypothetical protein
MWPVPENQRGNSRELKETANGTEGCCGQSTHLTPKSDFFLSSFAVVLIRCLNAFLSSLSMILLCYLRSFSSEMSNVGEIGSELKQQRIGGRVIRWHGVLFLVLNRQVSKVNRAKN